MATAGHIPYDWNGPENIRGSGLDIHLTSTTSPRLECVAANEFRFLPDDLLKRKINLGSSGNTSFFMLGYGPTHTLGNDDFEFNNPLFRQTRFRSLFEPDAPITHPVAFLTNIHYKGIKRGREPRKMALRMLARALAQHLDLPTSDWLHKICDFATAWSLATPEMQCMATPILDMTRHLFDAFPKVYEPMHMPGLVLIDRPDRFCSPSKFQVWMNLLDSLFPHLQFVCTLPQEATETLQPTLARHTLAIPPPPPKKPGVNLLLSRGSVLLLDVDSTIPNLALMKLGRYHKDRGKKVTLARGVQYFKGCGEVYASSIFYKSSSTHKLKGLKRYYGERMVLGGSGVDLQKRLSPEIEALTPDFSLYPSLADQAIGFLTRGCPLKCAFCIVPVKDGKTRIVNDFDTLLQNRKKLILLDDNILASRSAEEFLEEMVRRELQVNFTQTFDLRLVNKERVGLIKRVACSNLRFNRNVFHFSLNDARHLDKVSQKYQLFDFSASDNVEFVCMYGFDTTLAEDVERFRFLRSLPGAYVFVQEYLPIRGGPAPMLEGFFGENVDQLIDELTRIIFKQNMKSMEKYYRWISRLYARTFGKLHMGLVDTIFKYNNRDRKANYIQTLAKTRKTHYL